MRLPSATAPDLQALDVLRQRAATDPRGAAKQAAVQFETLFMQMVMRSMREATPAAGGMPGSGQETFTAMLDAQFASRAAGQPGGLADMIERQLTRHLKNLPEPAAPASPAGAPSPPPATASGKSRAEAFVREMLPHAQEAERRTGVPASYILGQAGLESGWGRSPARHADGRSTHNLFGIKATASWEGPSAQAATTEFEGGQPVRRREAFRSYASPADAFADHAKLLTRSRRYAQAAQQTTTPEAFAAGLQRAGYATDPRYAEKLAGAIRLAEALQRKVG